MATLGHLAVGVAAARVYRRGQSTRWPVLFSMAMWSLIAMLPDVDVIGYPLGVSYEAAWGHRGATHSLAFAAVIALAVSALADRFRLPRRRTAIGVLLVIASHPLLDALTNGGLGCALLFPIESTRYVAPWNPIPVAESAQDLLSPHGLFVVGSELVMFSPLLIYAGWPRAGEWWFRLPAPK